MSWLKKALTHIVLCWCLVMSVSHCGASWDQVLLQNAVTVSNHASITVEALQVGAESFYKLQQQEAVSGAKDREDAQAKVAAVRAKWKDVWSKFALIRKTHKALVSLISSIHAGTSSDKGVIDLAQSLIKLYEDIQGIIAEARK